MTAKAEKLPVVERYEGRGRT